VVPRVYLSIFLIQADTPIRGSSRSLAMAEERVIPCTFESCQLAFNSTSDMQHHKANADGHSYCMKCDLDFPNHQALHLHKIISDRHFACPECCLELRSEAGLEVHMRNNHHEDREVACVGCGCKYKSAAAVVKHIEDKECPVLSLPDRIRDGVNFDIRAGSLLAMGRVSPAPHVSRAEDSSEDEDTDGGVPLNLPCADVKGKRPSRGTDEDSLPCDEWPDLAAPSTPWKGKPESTSTDSPGGVLLDDLVDIPVSRSGPFPLPSASSPQGPQAGPSNYASFSRQRNTIHGHVQGVNPEHFWNAEKGRYYCNCGASFLYVATFEYHLTMEDETINDCPRCFKRFVSLAALVAHMEARWSKCAVRATTAQMEQELSEITQGLADIPRLYTESELGAIDVDMSSQPEHNSPGSSFAEAVSSIDEPISSDEREIRSYVEFSSTHAEFGSSYPEPIYSSSDPGAVSFHVEFDSTHVEARSSQVRSVAESLAEDLRGLVFPTSQYEDEEEEL
ncbi:hypothetical protein N7457_004289, partial [Penicillium paradoxum]|uniref:uncharacterized protein n=1 Tax=Penicillium paradoxum TaxID=176176 RepID=UPI0025492598